LHPCAPGAPETALSVPQPPPLPLPAAYVPLAGGEVRLRDGAVVRLRDATAADDAGLRAMFYTLSMDTRYLYFATGVPANDAWAARVAWLGVARGAASYAMVAEVAGTVVGVARFDRNRPPREASAEIGILLTDAWQGRGLGRAVVARLQCEAQTRGLI